MQETSFAALVLEPRSTNRKDFRQMAHDDDALAAAFAEELTVVARRWREVEATPCTPRAGSLRDEILAELDPDQLRSAVALLQRLRDRLGADPFS
ncbi:hypothetical protein [Phenylobacterium deserti]|uniref:Uncharacterized protein n=1 Tax=Phenylobacterium deserti TaxID=1914756 RepID=A0A328AS53_9CAUL|nr:hypothetical protein [Phenylobacterium deserti]RAK57780.1 hypothetical protein DJ018_07625 [Phenylobacterium deserti]